MKKQNVKHKIPKSNSGITLIALVITIVLLLILAVVSIKLVMNTGIITHAENTTLKYKIGEEKEKISLAYNQYQMEKATKGSSIFAVDGANIIGTGTYGWMVGFEQTKNKYAVLFDGTITPKETTADEAALEKFFLGENYEGKNIEEVLADWDYETGVMGNIEGNEIKHLNDAEFEGGYNGKLEDKMTTIAYYFTYKNSVYKLILIGDEGDNIYIDNLSLCYTPKGKEGQTITYNGQEWIILYDNGDTVEMVSKSTIGSLQLGEGIIGNVEKDVYLYNNAISRLNNYCESLVDTTDSNIKSVRSVGSNPNNKSNESTMTYSSEKLAASGVKGTVKAADINFEDDFVRMCYWGVETASDGKGYWLASRALNVIDQSGGGIYYLFSVWYVDGYDNRISFSNLWELITRSDSNGNEYCHATSNYHPDTKAVRPVVKINSSAIETN